MKAAWLVLSEVNFRDTSHLGDRGRENWRKESRESNSVELIKTVMDLRLARGWYSFISPRTRLFPARRSPEVDNETLAAGIASIRANQFAKRFADYFLVPLNRSPEPSTLSPF